MSIFTPLPPTALFIPRGDCYKLYMRDLPGGPVVKTLPFNSGGVGSIPGPGAKIPLASRPKQQKIKQKQYCNTFSKGFKSGSHQKTSWRERGSRWEEGGHSVSTCVSSQLILVIPDDGASMCPFNRWEVRVHRSLPTLLMQTGSCLSWKMTIRQRELHKGL